MAVWSNDAGAGPAAKFVRVGTLDGPDQWPPDIHISTESKQPWVIITPTVPAVPAYCEREQYRPAESFARRFVLLPKIEGYPATLRGQRT